jgi:hypothetical protein
VAHEVKNPLNAMVLQLALLTEKIAGAGEPLASSCAGNLGSLRNQIARVDEVVRRLADVSDPAPGTAFDLGGLAADIGSLFAHEARRRRVVWTCEASRGLIHARGDAARLARLLLGLAWRALSRAENATVALRAAVDGADALVSFEHPRDRDPSTDWVPATVAEALAHMDGRLEWVRGDDRERLEVRLRREVAP